jgi:hypothetical protein
MSALLRHGGQQQHPFWKKTSYLILLCYFQADNIQQQQISRQLLIIPQKRENVNSRWEKILNFYQG